MEKQTRREFLISIGAMGVLVACAQVPLPSTPTLARIPPTPTPTPTPTPIPPDILLTGDAASNAVLVQSNISALEAFALRDRGSLRIGVAPEGRRREVYQLSLRRLENPGSVLVLFEESTGVQKSLFLQERVLKLATSEGKVESQGQLQLPSFAELLKRLRESMGSETYLGQLLEKIAQEELFRAGITVAALVLAGWLLLKLGAVLLSALAAIAFIVLIVALAAAGAGAIKVWLEMLGITPEDMRRFLKEGIQAIRDFLTEAMNALENRPSV